MALSKAQIDQLGEHLKTGKYANAEDMITLKELINYEVNTRRQQHYPLTSEKPKSNKQFDTAKFINNLLGALRKIHKGKFQLVTQNVTFIKALYDIFLKIKKLMEYEYQRKYSDNAGCDGECRGLCSSCVGCCVGGSVGASYGGGGGGGGISTAGVAGGGCGSGFCSNFISDHHSGTSGYCGGGYTSAIGATGNPTLGTKGGVTYGCAPNTGSYKPEDFGDGRGGSGGGSGGGCGSYSSGGSSCTAKEHWN